AERAGVEVVAETMVTGWEGARRLQLTGPGGRWETEPAAVVLASGCRERPRSARLVPGSRPAGVMTTSTLQQLVYLHGQRVGRRAVVVGAEHVSFSAVATLAHGGATVAAMVTELPRHQTLAAFRAGAALRYRARVWTRTRLAAIQGGPRVEEVELIDLDTGRTERVACDLVVFTADWIPDAELAALAGCELDPATRGPRADPALRTTVPGVFGAGNVLHPAEPADVAALDGRHAAAAVAAHLGGEGEGWPFRSVAFTAAPPLRWVFPNLVSPDSAPPPRDSFLVRPGEFARGPRIEVLQARRTLWESRVRRLVPGRSARIPGGWTRDVDPGAGPVSVRARPR
ncbi:MAG: NAD(P)/FAD-dependent oxidoreductase, partial [Solirubrobacterales bacterium]